MSTTTRTRWNPSNPIVCQADMEDALSLKKNVQQVMESLPDGSLEKMAILIKFIDIETAIMEREENSI